MSACRIPSQRALRRHLRNTDDCRDNEKDARANVATTSGDFQIASRAFFWVAHASRVSVSASRRNRLLNEQRRVCGIEFEQVPDREDSLAGTRQGVTAAQPSTIDGCSSRRSLPGSRDRTDARHPARRVRYPSTRSATLRTAIRAIPSAKLVKTSFFPCFNISPTTACVAK